jgi:RNA recognition motif-containing protein
MGKKLYVGNLAYGVTDSTLEQLFVAHGAVQSAKVVIDRDTGRSKGFGFVEMSSDAEAQAATTALNLKEVESAAENRRENWCGHGRQPPILKSANGRCPGSSHGGQGAVTFRASC